MEKLERIRHFIAFTGLNPSAFSTKIGYNQSNLSKILNEKRDINSNLENAICNAFPELNRKWLLFGEGEMLNHSHSITQHQNGGSGNSQSVTLGHYDVSRFLDELSAQRRITEKAQEQIDRLITLLENK